MRACIHYSTLLDFYQTSICVDKFKCPGERLNEITEDQLQGWGKTLNCKFYVADADANTMYKFPNGEHDKVCICT